MLAVGQNLKQNVANLLDLLENDLKIIGKHLIYSQCIFVNQINAKIINGTHTFEILEF